MLLELAREEVPSLYNEVDVTSKENSLASSPHGMWGVGEGSGHLPGLGPRMGPLEESRWRRCLPQPSNGLELLIQSGSSQGEVLEGGPVGVGGTGLMELWEAGTGWRRAKRMPGKGVRRW